MPPPATGTAEVAAPRPSEPLFLERQTYRRRRLMDAARLLPVAGAVLFALPVLWAGPAAERGAGTAAGGVYLFAVWGGLIVAAAVMSRRLVRTDAPLDGGAGATADRS